MSVQPRDCSAVSHHLKRDVGVISGPEREHVGELLPALGLLHCPTGL